MLRKINSAGLAIVILMAAIFFVTCGKDEPQPQPEAPPAPPPPTPEQVFRSERAKDWPDYYGEIIGFLESNKTFPFGIRQNRFLAESSEMHVQVTKSDWDKSTPKMRWRSLENLSKKIVSFQEAKKVPGYGLLKIRIMASEKEGLEPIELAYARSDWFNIEFQNTPEGEITFFNVGFTQTDEEEGYCFGLARNNSGREAGGGFRVHFYEGKTEKGIASIDVSQIASFETVHFREKIGWPYYYNNYKFEPVFNVVVHK